MFDSIKLGDKVRDKISGFEGIASGKSTYLNGCFRILIEPMKLRDDGTTLDSVWFDVQQVEVVEADPGVIEQDALVGGPMSNPTRAADAPKW